MVSVRNRLLLAVATTLALAALLTSSSPVYGGETTAAATVECSPCVNGNGVHDWVLACCYRTPDCYMYPDASQYGNLGSCPGMHRPCDAVE